MKESFVNGDRAIVANDQATEVAEPGEGAFHFPAVLVAAQRSAVLGARFAAIPAMRRDQFDASCGQPLTQRIAVVGTIANHPLWFLAGASTAMPPGYADRQAVSTDGKRVHVSGTVTASGNYATSGDTLDLSQFPIIAATQAPIQGTAWMDGLSGYDFVFYPGSTMNSGKLKIFQQGASAGAFPELASWRVSLRDYVGHDHLLRHLQENAVANTVASAPTTEPAQAVSTRFQLLCSFTRETHEHRNFLSVAPQCLQHVGDPARPLRRACRHVPEPF